jgi:hypothetical protein
MGEGGDTAHKLWWGFITFVGFAWFALSGVCTSAYWLGPHDNWRIAPLALTIGLPSTALGLAVGLGGHAALREREYGALASIGLAWSIAFSVGSAIAYLRAPDQNAPGWLYVGHSLAFAGMVVFVIHGRRITRAKRAARRDLPS